MEVANIKPLKEKVSMTVHSYQLYAYAFLLQRRKLHHDISGCSVYYAMEHHVFLILLFRICQHFIDKMLIFMEVAIMKPLKEKVSITLDYNIILEIRDLSEKDDRSFSQYINLILKEYLDRIKHPKDV